jgi:hypothetical protein
MSERSFQMRLSCRYEQPDNGVGELRVKHFEEGEWRELDLNCRSPGFVIFVYAMFACEHVYFRANCAERGLVLESADGAIDVLTSEDWDLKRLRVRFDGRLVSGSPTADDVKYIVGRMKQCPVSRNTVEVTDSETVVQFT